MIFTFVALTCICLKVEYSAVTEQECITVQDEKCELKYDTVQVKLFFNHDDLDDDDDDDDDERK